jgi:hypothetical protein
MLSVEGEAVTMVSSRSSSSVMRVGMASRFVPKREPPGGGGRVVGCDAPTADFSSIS